MGWLASSLIPASRREQQAASQVKAKVSEHSGAVTEKLSAVASDLRRSCASRPSTPPSR
ncbi:hypothetical protein NKG94_44565 [Micromonospora sp. M12]